MKFQADTVKYLVIVLYNFFRGMNSIFMIVQLTKAFQKNKTKQKQKTDDSFQHKMSTQWAKEAS